MDRGRIFTELTERNALRREAGLPLLDMREEFDRAVAVERWREWQAVVEAHADMREAIRQRIQSERQAQGRTMESVGGRWAVRVLADREFEEALARLGHVKPPLASKHLTSYGGATD